MRRAKTHWRFLTAQYNFGYTLFMKTAISVPDPIFAAADDLAKRLGISRSELYATAVKRYLDSFSDETITQMLNEVYDDAAETLDPVLMQMQRHTLPDEDWS